MITPQKYLSLILSPLWRWKWLLLACLVVTIGYGLFALSYKAIFDPTVFITISPIYPAETTLGHGWPFEFERRYIPGIKGEGRWLIGSNVAWFSGTRLLGNLAVAVGISLLLTYVIAWRFSAAKRWQFGLKDVMAMTVGVAFVLSAAKNAEYSYQEEVLYLQNLGWRSNRSEKNVWYLLPLRDVGLLREEALYRADNSLIWYGVSHEDDPRSSRQSELQTLDVNEQLRQQADSRRRLVYPLDKLAVQDDKLEDQGVEALARWAPSCQTLELTSDSKNLTDQATAQIIETWPNLRTLRLGSPGLTTKSLQQLGKLKQAELILFVDCAPGTWADELRFLDEMPKLRTLGLPPYLHNQVSPRRLEELKNRGVDVSSHRFMFLH